VEREAGLPQPWASLTIQELVFIQSLATGRNFSAPLRNARIMSRGSGSPALPPGSRPPHRRALTRGRVEPPQPAPGNGEPADNVPGEVQQVHVVRHVPPDKAFVLFTGMHMRYLFPRVFATTPAGHIGRDQRQLPADGARTGTDAAGRGVRLRCGPWPLRAYVVPIVLI
jgi:hypothetical protein